MQSAKAFVGAFIEQSMLCGKISPPSGIFLAKNWLGYKDTISLEDASNTSQQKAISPQTPEEIAAKYGKILTDGEPLQLPDVPEVPD